MELIRISVLTKNVERRFSVFNSSFDEPTKYFGGKLITQTYAINFNGTSYIWFRYGKITVWTNSWSNCTMYYKVDAT